MSKNKPTEVGQGLAALLGTPDPQPPSVESVETPDERAVRLAAVLNAIDSVVEPTSEGPDFEALKADVAKREQEYLDAEAVFRQAEKRREQAQAAKDAATAKMLAADPRSEQDLNAEYIALQVAERARVATEAAIKFEAAKRTGIFSPAELARMAPCASPLTQMIQNQKVLEKRARDLAGR